MYFLYEENCIFVILGRLGMQDIFSSLLIFYNIFFFIYSNFNNRYFEVFDFRIFVVFKKNLFEFLKVLFLIFFSKVIFDLCFGIIQFDFEVGFSLELSLEKNLCDIFLSNRN